MHYPPPQARPVRWMTRQKPARWFIRQKRSMQVLACCVVLFLEVILCGSLASLMPSAGATPADVTPTTIPIAQIAPTQTPTHALATRAPTAIPTRKPTPHVQPTPKPQPVPTKKPSCPAVNGNPWCYTFSPGSLIYSPPSAFCDYFSCIPTFWNGRGYVIECQDGDYSKSGGIRGSCSHHGGDLRALYAH